MAVQFIHDMQGLIPVRRPKTCQQMIPVKKVFEDGVFYHEKGRYSATYKIKDIDYRNKNEDEQKFVLGKWSDVLNLFNGSKDEYQITLYNSQVNVRERMNNTFIPTNVGDGYDHHRLIYNEMTWNDIESGGVEKGIYLTTSSYRKNRESASAVFDTFGKDISAKLQEINSNAVQLNCEERLRLFHDFFRPGYEKDYNFKYNEKNAKYFKDYVIPERVKIHSSYLEVNDRFCRGILIRTWSDYIKDTFMNELMDVSPNMAVTLSTVPYSLADSKKFVADKESYVEGNVYRWTTRPFAPKNNSSRLPKRFVNQREAIDQWNEDVNKRNQKVFMCEMTIVFMADSLTDMESYTESIMNTINEHTFSAGILWDQQIDAVQNTLPFGVRTIDNLRDCNTETTAIMMPFSNISLDNVFGIPFGRHYFRKKQQYVNILAQPNGHTITLGKTGYGKSMNLKKKIYIKVLLLNGFFIILDPQGEYTPLVEELGGQVVYLGQEPLNIMEVNWDLLETGRDLIKEKSTFILSFIESILGEKDFGENEKSIADRCLNRILKLDMQNYYDGPVTMVEWLEELKLQPEPEAAELALKMERHINGSFNCFARRSVTRGVNRILCYNMQNVSKQDKDACMIVALDDVNRFMKANKINGIPTFIEIDEADYFFKHQSSIDILEDFFETARHDDGIISLAIQYIEKILVHTEARTMLAMCDNVVMMRQDPIAARTLKDMFELSENQYDYLINAEPGEGINKIGNIIYQFEDIIDKNSKLYEIINTDKNQQEAS